MELNSAQIQQIIPHRYPFLLVDKILEVAAEPARAKLLADNARLSYLSYYTPEKNYGVLINIYNKALAQKQRHNEQHKLGQPLSVSLSNAELSKSLL